jgi:hypothetical protein
MSGRSTTKSSGKPAKSVSVGTRSKNKVGASSTAAKKSGRKGKGASTQAKSGYEILGTTNDGVGIRRPPVKPTVALSRLKKAVARTLQKAADTSR